jgi:hypothetical protein
MFYDWEFRKMTCTDTCQKYKVKNNTFPGISLYKLGYKRCSHCDLFLDWAGIFCPCCGIRLGTKPKGKNGRANMVGNRI